MSQIARAAAFVRRLAAFLTTTAENLHTLLRFGEVVTRHLASLGKELAAPAVVAPPKQQAIEPPPAVTKVEDPTTSTSEDKERAA